MKQLVILGAGTAGTTLANHLVKKLPHDWSLTVVDPSPSHLYQPGLLFLPFGGAGTHGIERRREHTLSPGVAWRREGVELVDTAAREVVLEGGDRLTYDLLVLATGSRISPEETPGLLGPEWGKSIHEFYTLEGAQGLARALSGFTTGRLVLNVVEMPIKCPVAPLEFAFLADAYFTERGLRDKVEIVYATPLDGAFTKPVASSVLGSLLEEKRIVLETEFSTGEVDNEGKTLVSYDGRRVPFDLLVSVPTHKGAAFLEASGLGNELGFVPTEPRTLKVKGQDHLFALGDTTDLPSSKAGSVAHFQSETLAKNLLRAIAGKSLLEGFDGHANCFVESGHGKALLIDFNYETEPLPGTYPLPFLGPFTLLAESRRNHWGKLGFRWLYWNALLPGRNLPVPAQMSMRGKHRPSSIAA